MEMGLTSPKIKRSAFSRCNNICPNELTDWRLYPPVAGFLSGNSSGRIVTRTSGSFARMLAIRETLDPSSSPSNGITQIFRNLFLFRRLAIRPPISVQMFGLFCPSIKSFLDAGETNI